MRALAALALLAAGTALAGCASTDPLLDREAWRPSGVNALNLAAQLAYPLDAYRGRSAEGGSDGHMAAQAVARLRADRVKTLPDSGLAELRVQGSPGAGAGAGAGTGAGAF